MRRRLERHVGTTAASWLVSPKAWTNVDPRRVLVSPSRRDDMYAALPVLAGIASTVIFASSTLPMLNKAWRTRELHSYSLGNLALANVGNAVYSVYVLSLAPGPVWALHAFNLSSTAFMLLWFLRFEFLPRRRRGSGRSGLRGVNQVGAPVGQGASRQDSCDVMVGGLE